MNKRELVDSVLEQTGWSRREGEEAVSAVLNSVMDAVASGDRVRLPGFGSFEKRERPAREARNPQTGETIKVKKTKVPAFKPGAQFKSYVAMNKKDQAAFRRDRG